MTKEAKIWNLIDKFMADLGKNIDFKVRGHEVDLPRDVAVSPITVLTNVISEEEEGAEYVKTIDVVFEEGGMITVCDSEWNVLSTSFNARNRGFKGYEEQIAYVTRKARVNGIWPI